MNRAIAKIELEKKLLSRRLVQLDAKAERLEKQLQELRNALNQLDVERAEMQLQLREMEKNLHLEHTLARLQNNDPQTQGIDTRGDAFPMGHARTLGEALRENTVVSSLILDLQKLVPSANGNESNLCLEPIIDFIADSNSLCIVGIVDEVMRPSSQRIAAMLLDAISINTGKSIVHLYCSLHVPSDEFCRTIAATPTIVSLNVNFQNSLKYSPEAKQSIASAIGSHKTLKRLRFAGDEQFSMLILTCLRDIAPELSALEVVSYRKAIHDMPYFTLLAETLKAAIKLKKFGMYGFCLRGSDFEVVLNGLQRTCVNGLRSMVTERMVLNACYFLSTVTDRLSSFLQTWVTNEHQEQLYASSLWKLRVEPKTGQSLDPFRSEKLASSLLMAETTSLCSGNPCQMMIPTIGSQIVLVALKRVHSEFFHTLARHSSRVRLRHLKLVEMCTETCLAFEACIPKLPNLEKIDLLSCTGEHVEYAISALKKNSTIHRMYVETASATQLQRIASFCDRNRSLHNMRILGLPKLVLVSGPNVAVNVWLYPSILHVAKPPTRAGASNVFTALLSLVDEYE
jgi:hypothetical protein